MSLAKQARTVVVQNEGETQKKPGIIRRVVGAAAPLALAGGAAAFGLHRLGTKGFGSVGPAAAGATHMGRMGAGLDIAKRFVSDQGFRQGASAANAARVAAQQVAANKAGYIPTIRAAGRAAVAAPGAVARGARAAGQADVGSMASRAAGAVATPFRAVGRAIQQRGNVAKGQAFMGQAAGNPALSSQAAQAVMGLGPQMPKPKIPKLKDTSGVISRWTKGPDGVMHLPGSASLKAAKRGVSNTDLFAKMKAPGVSGKVPAPSFVSPLLHKAGSVSVIDMLQKVADGPFVAETIDWASIPKESPRGAGPVVTWNAPAMPPFYRSGESLVNRAVEFARAQDLGSGVENAIREHGNQTMAIDAIRAVAHLS